MALKQSVISRYPFNPILGFPASPGENIEPCTGCLMLCHHDVLALACHSAGSKDSDSSCIRCKNDKKACRKVPEPLRGMAQMYWWWVSDLQSYIVKHMGEGLSRRPTEHCVQYAISRGIECVEATGQALAHLASKVKIGPCSNDDINRTIAANTTVIAEQNAALADLLLEMLRAREFAAVSDAMIEEFARRTKAAKDIFAPDHEDWKLADRCLVKLKTAAYTGSDEIRWKKQWTGNNHPVRGDAKVRQACEKARADGIPKRPPREISTTTMKGQRPREPEKADTTGPEVPQAPRDPHKPHNTLLNNECGVVVISDNSDDEPDVVKQDLEDPFGPAKSDSSSVTAADRWPRHIPRDATPNTIEHRLQYTPKYFKDHPFETFEGIRYPGDKRIPAPENLLTLTQMLKIQKDAGIQCVSRTRTPRKRHHPIVGSESAPAVVVKASSVQMIPPSPHAPAASAGGKSHEELFALRASLMRRQTPPTPTPQDRQSNMGLKRSMHFETSHKSLGQEGRPTKKRTCDMGSGEQ
ncbi:hypothetical protein B0T16DRAFT_492483 [Cercophora newfieldiana]|uniref:Uncharacterized protein n=1 Tax=Cercophora newfieldiana TaxID=92897 RepID=A0AA39YFA9_9PEZI|nr:hypothetical protein B0T16DRAFT_492483 [Cercophora newfieldiana]